MKKIDFNTVRTSIAAGIESASCFCDTARKAIVFRKFFGHFPYLGEDQDRQRIQKIAVDRKLGIMARTVEDSEVRFAKFSVAAPCLIKAAGFKKLRDLKRQGDEMSCEIAGRTYVLQSALQAAKVLGIQVGEKDQYAIAYRIPPVEKTETHI